MAKSSPDTVWAAGPLRVQWNAYGISPTLKDRWSAGPVRAEWVTGVYNASNP